MSMKLAVIGAGVSGLTCAIEAQKAGHDVTVFDKGRGPGGRLSTRRIDTPAGQVRFDHGAMGFRPRSEEFAAACEVWRENGWIAPWQPRIADHDVSGFHPRPEETHYTGIPGMNGLIKGLASELSTQFSVRIHGLENTGNGWVLTFEDDTPDFHCDGVVCATPAEQAQVLLKPVAPELAENAGKAKSDPCWAIMLAYDAPLPFAYDLVFSDTGPFRRMIRNNAKPDRGSQESWVLQSQPDWAAEHLDWPKSEIIGEALSAFKALTGATAEPLTSDAHRWLYAQIRTAAGHPADWDNDMNIGTCGDWHIGPDIESGWMSGRILGERLKSLA